VITRTSSFYCHSTSWIWLLLFYITTLNYLPFSNWFPWRPKQCAQVDSCELCSAGASKSRCCRFWYACLLLLRRLSFPIPVWNCRKREEKAYKNKIHVFYVILKIQTEVHRENCIERWEMKCSLFFQIWRHYWIHSPPQLDLCFCQVILRKKPSVMDKQNM
jgi:hypothetical protein